MQCWVGYSGQLIIAIIQCSGKCPFIQRCVWYPSHLLFSRVSWSFKFQSDISTRYLVRYPSRLLLVRYPSYSTFSWVLFSDQSRVQLLQCSGRWPSHSMFRFVAQSFNIQTSVPIIQCSGKWPNHSVVRYVARSFNVQAGGSVIQCSGRWLSHSVFEQDTQSFNCQVCGSVI